MIVEKAIRIFVIDDSAVVRTTIAAVIDGNPGIVIAGTAADPIQAMEKFARTGWPDVIILDIDMPRMDGLTFMKQLARRHPIPVVICSSVAQEGSRAAMEALALGAVEVIPKPAVGIKSFLEDSRQLFLHAIRAAAASRVAMADLPEAPAPAAPAPSPKPVSPGSAGVVAVGASTGGVQTFEKILRLLPENAPPILLVQHMPAGFTRPMAQRLDKIGPLRVKEAEHGDHLLPGRILIAPGEMHLTLRRRPGGSYTAEVKPGPRVNRHCPSVDVLFRSCAKEAGKHAIGVLLTGMGDDGARGLLEMRQAGARTYTQDEASSIVYGMPREAVSLGASLESANPEGLAAIIAKG